MNLMKETGTQTPGFPDFNHSRKFMTSRVANSSSSGRAPESPSSHEPSSSANVSKRKVKKPVVKMQKDDEEPPVRPEKKKKSAGASVTTRPEFQSEESEDAKPAKKSRQPRKEDPSTSSEESGPFSFTTTRNNRDRVEKSANSHSANSVTSPRSDNIGRAMLAIQRGELDTFQHLVPQYVSVDSVSSKGFSLLAIAKHEKQPDIVEYIKQQFIGRAIKAIETADVEAFKALVPVQVQPDAVSTNGRSLLKIARYRQQQLQTIIKYLESGMDEEDRTAPVPTANAPRAIADAKSKKVRVIEFYEKNYKYYEFTNFYEGKPIKIDGVSWKTAEHYFQAQKFVGHVKLQKILQKKETAKEALDFATTHADEWRPDWLTVNVAVMRTALSEKFRQDQALGKLLCGTGDAKLVEAAPRDNFWGYGPDGKGKDMLGKLLMELRTALQEEM